MTTFFTRFLLSAACLGGFLVGTSEARSEMLGFPGGFRLGSSLEEAERHARSRGWELVRLSPALPHQWMVAGNTEAQIGLFTCDETISGIHQTTAGNLDDFATLVTNLRDTSASTEPSISIVTFKSGGAQISNVDVRFEEENGFATLVQLSSISGQMRISTSYSMQGECQTY